MSNKQLKEIRRVTYGDIILETDDNDQIDNWKAQLDINNDLKFEDPELEDLLNQLKAVISQMYYVKYGDYVRSELHNLFVDAWKLQEQINEKLRYWKELGVKPDIWLSRCVTFRVVNIIEAKVSKAEAYNTVVPLVASITAHASVYVPTAKPLRVTNVISGSGYMSRVATNRESRFILSLIHI